MPDDVPLREHLETMIAALDRRVDTALEGIREATALALKTLPTKEDIEKRLSRIERQQSFAAGRAALLGAAFGIVGGILASVVTYMVAK